MDPLTVARDSRDRRCPCDSERLSDPRPALKVDGRMVRWATTCACGNVVVIDAKTGEDASERSGYMLHDQSVPHPAA